MLDKLFICLAVSYLIGCFNTGYYYVKFNFNKDIRSIGSFSTGATNASRISGKKGFIITFLGDSIKGILTIILVKYLNLSYTETQLCLLAVVAGHIFPIQLGFKGGKGISTILGGLLAFDYTLIILFIANLLILFIFIRNYKISGILSFILLLVEYLIINHNIINSSIFCIIIIVIVVAHRENFKNKFSK